MHKSPGDSSREDCRVIHKLFWNQVISWNVMELTTMSVVCPFPPSFGIAKMASNLKNPHFIKDKSTSKSGFMSGLQHAVYNINPEETVMTWQFSEFYILLSASMLIRKSEILTCVMAEAGHVHHMPCLFWFPATTHYHWVTALTGLQRRPKLNTWVHVENYTPADM